MVDKWGRVVADRARLVLVTGVLLVVAAAAYGSGVFDSLSQGGFDDPASESARELALERETFGNAGVDVIAIYSSDDLTVDDPAFRDEVAQTLAGIPGGTTTTVLSYYDTGSADFVSGDEHATRVLISLAGDSQNEYLENFEVLEPTLESDTLETHLAGAFAVYGDVNEITESDLRRAEILSAPLVLLLSVLIFGSLVAAVMPVVVGVVAVLGALAVVQALTGVTEISIFAINVITLLGLGLAIDYALFMISRFREELARFPEDDPNACAEAIRRTMATAGRTVLFSGLTVAAALSSLLVFPQNFVRSMGYGGMAAVVIAMLAALTILPATLRLLGRRIDAGRVPFLHRRRAVGSPDLDPDQGAWARLARSVMRRPVLYAVAVVTVLLVVASPFLRVVWGSVDYRVLPEDAPSRVAAEILNEEFGPETSTANVLLRGVDQAGVSAYTEDALAVPGVTDVAPLDARGEDTLVRVTWVGNSQSEASQQVVKDLRALEVDNGSALVGGLSADTVDLLSSVGSRLPWMAAIVIGVMLVLLFIAFGSVVLPIKAVAMNIISISASFGVVTWVFAQGNLEGLLGFESQGFLDATQPLVMLAIIFGLSMDYEVFLLSRIREEYDATGDNTRAVAVGLQKTGRIITSAALLLAVVIGAFATSGIVFMKLIGLGMLVALLVDATIVRALLVPATMKLLGDANWWAPGPLARWWERHGFREEGREPTAEREPELV